MKSPASSLRSFIFCLRPNLFRRVPSLRSLLTVVALTAGLPTPATATETILTDSQPINGFGVSAEGIHWWSGRGNCGELPSVTRVSLRGIEDPAAQALLGSCTSHVSDVILEDFFVH